MGKFCVFMRYAGWAPAGTAIDVGAGRPDQLANGQFYYYTADRVAAVTTP